MAMPLYDDGVKGHDVAPAAGHEVRHGVASPVRQSEVAESCVDDAYTNCDASVLEVATR